MPAAVFQSVIIGGGYGTGREVIEYVTRHGAWGGFIAISIIALIFAAVLSTSFVFAQRFKVFNYRSFLISLLGPYWLLYEVLFLLLLTLVLAIVSAAISNIFSQRFGTSPIIAVISLMSLVSLLNYYGREFVEKLLSFSSIVLMLSLSALTIFTVTLLYEDILRSFSNPAVISEAIQSGAQFAIYNSALIPVLIYCAANANSRSEAMKAGLIAGLFGAAPALMLHITFLPYMPEIMTQDIPTYYLLEKIGLDWAITTYFLILTSTIILTAVGVLQGVNERIDSWKKDTNLSGGLTSWQRALVAATLTLVSIFLAKFGIVALIAKGYGSLSWGFLIVFTVPLMTIGVVKIRRKGKMNEA
jgi:uncharacterized membrane protein YkvI